MKGILAFILIVFAFWIFWMSYEWLRNPSKPKFWKRKNKDN